MMQHDLATNFDEYKREICCVTSKEMMRSAGSIKRFIAEQYLKGIFSHFLLTDLVTLMVLSATVMILSGTFLVMSIMKWILSQIWVKDWVLLLLLMLLLPPDMTQILTFATSNSHVTIAQDMGQILTFATSNSHIVVDTCIGNSSEVT